ncbi:hypothetical protein BDV06DRAFT_68165 [Aspergillus oleicola]
MLYHPDNTPTHPFSSPLSATSALEFPPAVLFFLFHLSSSSRPKYKISSQRVISHSQHSPSLFNQKLASLPASNAGLEKIRTQGVHPTNQPGLDNLQAKQPIWFEHVLFLFSF